MLLLFAVAALRSLRSSRHLPLSGWPWSCSWSRLLVTPTTWSSRTAYWPFVEVYLMAVIVLLVACASPGEDRGPGCCRWQQPGRYLVLGYIVQRRVHWS